jgi:hypothetical protein
LQDRSGQGHRLGVGSVEDLGQGWPL